MLPLGLRVQEKLEQLIDKHMRLVGEKQLSITFHRLLLTKKRRIEGLVVFNIGTGALGTVWSFERWVRGWCQRQLHSGKDHN